MLGKLKLGGGSVCRGKVQRVIGENFSLLSILHKGFCGTRVLGSCI